MAKKTKKTGAKKAPVKQIYIHNSADWGKGYITERKLINAIKRGEKINVKSKEGVKLVKEVKKQIKETVFKPNPKRTDFNRKLILNEIKNLDADYFKTVKDLPDEELQKIIKTADKIIIDENDKDFKALKGVKSKRNRAFSKKEYEKLYIDFQLRKKEYENNVQLFMRQYAEKNGIAENLVFVNETNGGMFFFQTGNFVDRVKETGAEPTIRIKDFQGIEKKFKSHTEASKFLKELNEQINDVLDIVNPKEKGKRDKQIYFRVSETNILNIDGVTVGINYDFSNIQIDANESDKQNFQQWFFDLNGYEIQTK